MAGEGIATMRFDSRGMGDSDGVPGMPEPAEYLVPDIHAALDVFASQVAAVKQFVLCGLCDGASAALIYAPTDARVSGLVLLNPWVSSAEGAALAMLRHYYWQRLGDPELWRKIATGRFDLRGSVCSLFATIRTARSQASDPVAEPAADPVVEAGARIDRAMVQALDAFAGRILLVLSGRDRTGAQYAEIVAQSMRWRGLMRCGQAVRVTMSDADHTFSRRVLRDALAREITDWLQR